MMTVLSFLLSYAFIKSFVKHMHKFYRYSKLKQWNIFIFSTKEQPISEICVSVVIFNWFQVIIVTKECISYQPYINEVYNVSMKRKYAAQFLGILIRIDL